MPPAPATRLLQLPDFPLEDMDRAAADTDLVMQLEQYMAEWSQVGCGMEGVHGAD